jgi:hypothetical protein
MINSKSALALVILCVASVGGCGQTGNHQSAVTATSQTILCSVSQGPLDGGVTDAGDVQECAPGFQCLYGLPGSAGGNHGWACAYVYETGGTSGPDTGTQ